MAPLLHVKGLSVHFPMPEGVLKAVKSIGFSMEEGETLAIVGESGCGKSVTAASLLRLVPPPGQVVSGEICFLGTDILRLPEEEMRKLRGNRISMVFQEPMTSLNPVFRIGDQIAEGLSLHRGLSRKKALAEAVELLDLVGIPSPGERLRDYPHLLSGGMRQRVMIAMALSCRPALLIADEPTTALDVTIQAQILELIDRLKMERNMGLLLITHDLGIVAERAANTLVMYAGMIVEKGPTAELFKNPLHPYTAGLLDSLPQRAGEGEPLKTIPGNVPNMLKELRGCGFCDRCPVKTAQCLTETPELTERTPGRFVRCWIRR